MKTHNNICEGLSEDLALANKFTEALLKTIEENKKEIVHKYNKETIMGKFDSKNNVHSCLFDILHMDETELVDFFGSKDILEFVFACEFLYSPKLYKEYAAQGGVIDLNEKVFGISILFDKPMIFQKTVDSQVLNNPSMRSTITHEFAHVLQAVKMCLSSDGCEHMKYSFSQDKSVEGYYNSDEEFNAYCIECTSGIEKWAIKNNKKIPNSFLHNLDNFYYFISNIFSDDKKNKLMDLGGTIRNMFWNLSLENKRKFMKKVAQQLVSKNLIQFD